MSCSKQSPVRRAFSLLEVMVVVVVIGLLAGAVAIKVSDYVDKARLNRAKSDIAVICDAVETFYAEHNRYPSNEEGLDVLSIQSHIDPWNNRYEYNAPGRDGPYEVVSYGADGREGGDGADEDIGSWDVAGGA